MTSSSPGSEYASRTDTNYAQAAVARVLRQYEGLYCALYIEIDRGPLPALNEERWTRPASLREKEDDAEDVVADYVRVMDARVGLDSYLNWLGGDELAVLDKLAHTAGVITLVFGKPTT